MAPIVARNLSIGDTISISGVVLTAILSLLALIVAYATYKLQRYIHRLYHRAHPVFELEALMPEIEEASIASEEELGL